MSGKNNGGPAFPFTTTNVVRCDGMTLRDYFAAQAMPLAMADYRLATCAEREPVADWTSNACLSHVAARAYELADAMLSARETT